MLLPLLVLLAAPPSGTSATPVATTAPATTPTSASTPTPTPAPAPAPPPASTPALAPSPTSPAPAKVLLRVPPPPAGAAVDGDLAEWTGEPSLTLAPGGQVSGSRKLRDDADFSARVWLALGPDGLHLAAEVRDDAVHFPRTTAEVATADHLELWVALPAPRLPPVAYANQFAVLETPAACTARETPVEDRPACLRWHEAQETRRRDALARLFVRQYLLSPLGVTEAWATAATEAAAWSPACCAAAKVIARAAPGGWRLEALLPLEVLPATWPARLDELSLVVDAADADRGRSKLEALVTSAPGRRAGEPETFLPARAQAPVRLEVEPPVPEARFRGDPAPSWAVFPARHVVEALVFENVHHGYQYAPEAPSPEVTRVPLAVRPLARAGALSLVEAAVGGRGYSGQPGPLLGLVTLRGAELVSERPLPQGRALAAASDGATARVAVLRRGSASLTGSGACGACEVVEVTVVELGADGAFRELWSQGLNLDDVETSADGLVHVSYADVAPIADPDLAEVGLSGTEVVEVGGAPAVRRPFDWRWVWDPVTRRYEAASEAAREREQRGDR